MPSLADILKKTSGVPWATIASVLAENVGVRMDATKEVVEQLQTWGAFLSRHALAKWTSALVNPIACEIHEPRCNATAVVRCQACGRRCCLAHVRLSFLAEGICEGCIEDKLGVARPVKEGDRLQAAFQTLGVRPNATWAAVKARYKKLVVEHNADAPQSAQSRAANTKHLKNINAAFAVVREHFERRAA